MISSLELDDLKGAAVVYKGRGQPWLSGVINDQPGAELTDETGFVVLKPTDRRTTSPSPGVQAFAVYEIPVGALQGSMPASELETYLAQAPPDEAKDGSVAGILTELPDLVENYDPNAQEALRASIRERFG